MFIPVKGQILNITFTNWKNLLNECVIFPYSNITVWYHFTTFIGRHPTWQGFPTPILKGRCPAIFRYVPESTWIIRLNCLLSRQLGCMGSCWRPRYLIQLCWNRSMSISSRKFIPSCRSKIIWVSMSLLCWVQYSFAYWLGITHPSPISFFNWLKRMLSNIW